MITNRKNGGGYFLRNPNKRKGFTLIELLAVIVILAIIALIATPIILNMINDAKKSAAKDSAYGYIAGIENYMALAQSGVSQVYDKNKLPGKDETLECFDKDECNNDTGFIGEINKITKGTKPEYVKLVFSNSNLTSGTEFIINGHKILYDGVIIYLDGENKPVKRTGPTKELAEEGETFIAKVYLNPTNLKEECTKDNIVNTLEPKSGCMKWYAFKEDDKTYTMILDRNTTNAVAWNSTGLNSDGMTVASKKLEEDTKDWVGDPHILSANDIAEITGAADEDKLSWDSKKTYGTSGIGNSRWYYLDGQGKGYSGWLKQYANATNKSKYYWLYDYTSGCKEYGCETEIAGNVSGYWTTSTITGKTSRVWTIYKEGQVNGDDPANAVNEGIRPVITIEKAKIK